MERLIYARIEPIVDPLFPQKQAVFRCGRSTTDQVTLSTERVEDTFSAQKKAGAVFVDLLAAYDTVWHRGLTCKLLRTLSDRHNVSFIMELVRNRSFYLTTGNGVQSRLRRLKTASLKNQSWLSSFLTCTPMTCLSQLPESLFTQMTWPSCILQKTGSRWRELSHKHGNPIIVFTEMEAKAQYH